MNRASLSTAMAVFAGLLMSPAKGETGTPLYSTSFEETEGYQDGKSILNQNGWSIFSAHQNNAQIASAKDGAEVLSGKAMLRVTTGTPLMHRVLTAKPIRGSLTFTALTSVDFDGGDRVVSRFYLSGSKSDGETNHRFKGACFGIEEKDHGPRFFYRDGESTRVLAEEYAVRSRAIYRFECRIDLETGTWSLRVFEAGNTDPIGEAAPIRLRGGLEAIDFLMLQGSPGTCFDGIAVETP